MSIYQRFLSYEQIVRLKKVKAIFEKPPEHFLLTNSIFIHIPKAAGMSLVQSLYGVNKSNHDTWLEHYRRDRKFYDNAFKFCFVREPVDRLISAFNYLNAGGKSEIDVYWRDRYLSGYPDLESFVMDGGLDVAMQRRVEHFIPQWEFIFDKNFSLKVDFVGRFENIESDFREVCVRLGINNYLANLNKTKGKLDSALSSQSLSIIKARYFQDFKLLGYPF